MSIFSYHLVNLKPMVAIKGIFSNPVKKGIHGLIHSEFMNLMTLGAPIFSKSRILIGPISIFMQWENEKLLDDYLNNDRFGKLLAQGWHIRLSFKRQWGSYSGFRIPEIETKSDLTISPVVAITIAKMNPLEIPRFIHWGRPVEKLVRDHPSAIFSLASIKFPNTVSTFSIWKSEKEMTDMVHGKSDVKKPERHSNAMKERERKDFHFEFTTLRFKPIAEFGTWKGRSNLTLFNENISKWETQ